MCRRTGRVIVGSVVGGFAGAVHATAAVPIDDEAVVGWPPWLWIAIAVVAVAIVVFVILYRAGGGITTGARLIVEDPDALEYAIVGRTTRIGSADDNDLVIDVERVSRHHCVVLHRKQEFVLKDLNALEGTLLNDRPIDGETPLVDGDRIRLGKRAGLVFRSG